MPLSLKKFGTSPYPLSFALLGTLLMGTLMWAMNRLEWGVNLWSSFVYLELVYNPLCEAAQMDAFFRQPVATYSNLIFFFFGMLVLALAFRDRNKNERPRNLLLLSPQYSFLFSLLFFIMFLASSMYHASMIRVLYFTDLVGIYSIGLFFLFYNYWKFHLVQSRLLIGQRRKNLILFVLGMLPFVCIGATYSFLTYKLYLLGFVNVIVLIQTIYFNYRYNKKYHKPLLVLAAVLGLLTPLGFISDALLCQAGVFSLGHSVFHILASTGIFSYYAYLRSECYG